MDSLPAYLTISAYQNEQAVVSGGLPNTDWKKVEAMPEGLPFKLIRMGLSKFMPIPKR